MLEPTDSFATFFRRSELTDRIETKTVLNPTPEEEAFILSTGWKHMGEDDVEQAIKEEREDAGKT